ncbi:hypothetical protein [Metabacillus idriensis]|uniref:hypothetical protein n=1 Tax=Metabacillus idriensis TaxID=324768 RepID=UPI003D2B2A47
MRKKAEEMNSEGKPSTIVIRFKDGRQMMFVKNDHFTANWHLFTQKMRDYNIAYAGE